MRPLPSPVRRGGLLVFPIPRRSTLGAWKSLEWLEETGKGLRIRRVAKEKGGIGGEGSKGVK